MGRHGTAGLAVAALLVGWSTPARSAYLSCQAELKQGTSCTEVTGTASNPIYLAASCQECSGGGSDVKCDPAERVTAAGLTIKNAANLAVPGAFSSTGATCDLGLPLFKLGTNLSAGQYTITVKAGGLPETVLLSFSVGGTSTDGQVPGQRDLGSGTGDLVSAPHTEAGLPLARDGGPGGEPGSSASVGDDSGCDCVVVGRPSGVYLRSVFGESCVSL